MEALFGTLIGTGVGAGFGMIPGISQIQQAMNNTVNSWWQVKPPDPQTIMQAWSNRVKNTKEMQSQMHVNGYSNDAISWYIAAMDYVLNPMQAVAAKDRNWISESDKEYIFDQNNIPKRWRDVVTKLARWFPSLSDVNLWLIRNVLDPTTVSTYSLDVGFDKPQGKNPSPHQMYKLLGMDDTFAEYEWYATWKMPSFYEAKYMYDWYQAHKNDPKETNNGKTHFDLGDFKYAMRTGNWPPFFQNLLTKILTSPPPRVLIGELYHWGILHDDDLPKYYDWAGYHGDLNEKLVEYTKARYAQGMNRHVKHYTASMLLKLYNAGKLHKKDFEDDMKEIGYEEDTISIFEKYLALENQLKVEKETIREAEEAYKHDEISKKSALEMLKKAGVDQALASAYIDTWSDIKKAKVKKLSKTELIDLAQNKLISNEDCAKGMMNLGYSAHDTHLLMALKGLKWNPKDE